MERIRAAYEERERREREEARVRDRERRMLRQARLDALACMESRRAGPCGCACCRVWVATQGRPL